MYANNSIGVAIITYNGQSYIEEQLKSILNQSIQPDRVIIYDDASTDQTFYIIKKFILDNALDWEVYQNNDNMGWCENCYQALQACNTDIIFWADQDDVWYSNKIKALSDVLLSRNDCMAAYSSWDYIDENGKKIYENRFNTKKIALKKVGILRSHGAKPFLGCAICVKKKLLEFITPAVYSKCYFKSMDWILHRCAYVTGTVLYTCQILFQRRIHNTNVTGSLKPFHSKTSYLFSENILRELYDVLDMQYKTDKYILDYFGKINKKLSYYELVRECNYFYIRGEYMKQNISFYKYIITLFRICKAKEAFKILQKDIAMKKWI